MLGPKAGAASRQAKVAQAIVAASVMNRTVAGIFTRQSSAVAGGWGKERRAKNKSEKWDWRPLCKRLHIAAIVGTDRPTVELSPRPTRSFPSEASGPIDGGEWSRSRTSRAKPTYPSPPFPEF